MNRNANKAKADVEIDGDIPALVRLLSSPAGMKRFHAREALVAAGDSAVDPLIEALNDDQDVVRWEAAKALVDLPSPRAASALVAALEDDEFDVRWAAAEALIALRTAGLGPLFEALEMRAESVWLREGAHHVLRNIHDRTTDAIVSPVLEALEHYYPELIVPFAARDAIEKLTQENTQLNKEQEKLR
jgi:HEAT repeat protein